MRVLFISNGHGEDAIAAAIIRHLPERVEAMALPIVGKGEAYRKLGRVELLGPCRDLPSGGFIMRNPLALLRDLRAGLGGLAWEQWFALKAVGLAADLVVAVGDITALVFTSALQGPRIFLGTAKTDYYRERGERYLGIERMLLRRFCRRVFVRDALTAANLVRRGVAAEFPGNPIMDVLTEGDDAALPQPLQAGELVLVLPGSRQDAYENWPMLLDACAALQQLRPGLVFAAALPPSLERERLYLEAEGAGWQSELPELLSRDEARMWLLAGQLGPLLRHARLCLGLAGTGNEQAAGAGLPVLSFVTAGTQYTDYFARRQQQLLGPALTIGPADPEALARLAMPLLDDENYRARLRAIAAERFGPPGGGQRLAAAIVGMLEDGY